MFNASYIIVILLVLVSNVKAYSCDCPYGPVNIDSAIKRSDFIIIGVIEKREYITALNERHKPWLLQPDSVTYKTSRFRSHLYRYTVTVHKVFKGKVKKQQIILYSAAEGGACGYPFIEKTKYIIYGYLMDVTYGTDCNLKHTPPFESTALWTHLCDRTQVFTDAEDTLLDTLLCPKGCN